MRNSKLTFTRWQIALVAIVLLLAPLVSYGFARLGEPQSVWLWRMLGVDT